MIAVQAIDQQDREIPEGVNHADGANVEFVREIRIRITREVNGRQHALLEGQGGITKPAREQFRHVAIGHEQSIADDEAGAAIGDPRKPGDFDSPYRTEGRSQRRFHMLVVEALPIGVNHRGVVALDDVNRRALVGNNDRLERELLRVVQLDAGGKLAVGLSCERAIFVG